MTERTSVWTRGDQEVSLARLYVIRALCLFLILGNAFEVQRMLFHAPPTDRGMIKAFLSGLWVMAFIGLRYPLKMVPLLIFEFVWKTIWLFAFGIPQWSSGVGSPRLGQDLWEIGAFPFVFALIIPWGYVWRHFVREPAERWR